jgi:hypothetical protein
VIEVESRPMPELSSEVKLAIGCAVDLSGKIQLAYPPNCRNTLRDELTVRYMSIAQDHREAIILLVRHGARSAAFALARSVYESCMRGMWAQFAATDGQLETLASKGIAPGFDAAVRQLARIQDDPHYASIKQKGWGPLSDYAHSGSLQLSRWTSDSGIEPVHSDAEIVDLLYQSDFWALLAAIGVLQAAGKSVDALQEILCTLQDRAAER